MKVSPFTFTCALASVALVFAFMSFSYSVFHQYDWNHPTVKVVCFAAIAFLLAHASQRGPVWTSNALSLAESTLAGLIIALSVSGHVRSYGADVFTPPASDIGNTTVASSAMVFGALQNPYSSERINVRRELRPEHRGFHYGPLMLPAYAPGVIFERSGYKVTSLIYLLASAVLLCLLIRTSPQPGLEHVAGSFTVLALFFLPERLWYEVLRQGANDVFPVMLVLASLLMLKERRYFLMALFAGLSFSAKFSPATFLIVHFCRRRLHERERTAVLKGLAVGLTPLLPFLVWDPAGFVNNVFLIRAFLDFDSTSLYSVLPPSLHVMLPVALTVGTGLAMWRGFSAELVYEDVLRSFTFLLIVAEVTFKEIHANHLLWFFPLFALILTSGRRGVLAHQAAARP